MHDAPSDENLQEKLLQQIWGHQRILRDELTTLDGRPLRVLHPGFWNAEAGPDFQGAILQFADDPPRSGDVEIDLRSSGWSAHHHDTNPAYRGVLLHVVWEAPAQPAPSLPVLVLNPFLDAPLDELEATLDPSIMQWQELVTGQCAAPLRDLPKTAGQELLHQAAEVRLKAKAGRFGARAKQAGWSQALWEGLFGALGFKQNIWPMRRLAELIPVLRGAEPSPGEPFAWQARLLGVAGLLPVNLSSRSSGAAYLKRVWQLWWRDRAQLTDFILPEQLWCRHGVRPANHPQRRLALAAHWLAAEILESRLEDWLTREMPDRELGSALLEVLSVPEDEFWSRHWTLRSRRFEQPRPLIGPPRITDLAVNVVLPWFWMRAVLGGNQSLQEKVEHRYFAWPPAEDNRLLKQARQRLFGGNPVQLTGAAQQQAVLQILSDFCLHSDALCQNCRFPQLVLSLNG